MNLFEYPLIDDINKAKCDINMLISPRNHRKSTQIQLYLIKRFIDTGEKFLILRRKVDETISASWLSSYSQEVLKQNEFELTSNNIDRYVVEFRLNNEVCGYGAYCSVSSKYKSNDYGFNTDITNVVLEEAIAENELETPKHYNLINKILSVVSTFCRSTQPKIYLLGNDCENGYHSPLIKSFDLTTKFATVNDVVKTIYKYLEKVYTVAYYYFSDDINKCEWLKGENNIKKIDFSKYERIKQVDYQIIYNFITYNIYIINGKYLYITSDTYKNLEFYNELEFLLMLGVADNVISNIQKNEFIGHNMLLMYYPNLQKYYSISVKNGKRIYKYIPQEKETKPLICKEIDLDIYTTLDIEEQYHSDYKQYIGNLMMIFASYNFQIIIDNLPLKLTLDELQITKLI